MGLKQIHEGVNPAVHWYYQSKKIPLINFVRQVYRRRMRRVVVVDIAAGSGVFMHELVRVIPEMIEKIYLVDGRYDDATLAAPPKGVIVKTRTPPACIENAVIVMMDVLAHEEDDVALLRQMLARCRGENHFFITVPAFIRLWTGHDIHVGHRRHYDLESLEATLNNAGLIQFHTRYLFAGVLPIVWGLRALAPRPPRPRSSLRPCHPVLNAVLRAYHFFEMHLLVKNPLIGTTCLAQGMIPSPGNSND